MQSIILPGQGKCKQLQYLVNAIVNNNRTLSWLLHQLQVLVSANVNMMVPEKSL